MFPYTLALVLLVRVIVALVENDKSEPEAVYKKHGGDDIKIRRRRKMKWFNRRKILNTGPLFNGHIIDVRAFYMLEFDRVPCVNFIGDINVTKHTAISRKDAVL